MSDKPSGWKLIGYDTFAREEYLIDTYGSRAELLVAAKKQCARIREQQPGAGGQGPFGIQDHLYLETPDGVRQRYWDEATDKDERRRELQDAIIQLSGLARIIALYPLEEWINAFNRAETTAPILDPTLYITYQHSPIAQSVKPLLEACLPLKRWATSNPGALTKLTEEQTS